MSVTAKKYKPQKSAHRENAYTPQKNALWKIFGSELSGTTTNFDQKPQCLRLENAPFTYDTASDVHFYGYRYYNPNLGRWISRDPVGEMGGDNLYGYTHNAPSLYIDALGQYGMGYTTYIFEPKECGEFDWWIKFTVTPASQEGAIVQSIKRWSWITDCDTGATEIKRPRGILPDEFSEDFGIERGSRLSVIYDHWHTDAHDNTKGEILVRGEAIFFPGREPKPPREKYLPHPDIPDNAYPPLTRRLRITWDCCDKCKSRDTIIEGQ